MRNAQDILSTVVDIDPDFAYYEVLFTKIQANVETNPDIAIESCKSLLEGLSKSILKRYKPSLSTKQIEALSVSVLFKEACTTLSDRCDLEPDLIQRSQSVVHLLGELRNERGDISHGRAVPKDPKSTIHLAYLAMRITDGITCYLLTGLRTALTSDKAGLRYEDHPEFNAQLDEAKPMGDLSYSLALYMQRPSDYEYELGLWVDSQEPSEGSEVQER